MSMSCRIQVLSRDPTAFDSPRMSRRSPRPFRILDRDMPQPLSITCALDFVVSIDTSSIGTVAVLGFSSRIFCFSDCLVLCEELRGYRTQVRHVCADSSNLCALTLFCFTPFGDLEFSSYVETVPRSRVLRFSFILHRSVSSFYDGGYASRTNPTMNSPSLLNARLLLTHTVEVSTEHAGARSLRAGKVLGRRLFPFA